MMDGGVNLFESPIVSHFDNVNVVANRIVKMKKLLVQNDISLKQFHIVLRKLLRLFECRYTERISGAVITGDIRVANAFPNEMTNAGAKLYD